MNPDFNITIIGAGVVGLAIAAELSKTYDNIVVVEKHSGFGQETSSRSSEVIHSGIYYPTGSLKAKLCVEGKELLYNYCKAKDIAYRKCGKLLVATNKMEAEELDSILKQSLKNGVKDGRKITAEEVKELEPNVNAEAALYFPSTGIIDSYGLMKQLQADAINNGVVFAYNSEIQRIKAISTETSSSCMYRIGVKDQADSFTSGIVINSAGLKSDKIALMLGINRLDYRIHYYKGEYFGVGNGKNKLLSHLIYPVPMKNIMGLGIHATIDLNGRLKLGPNAIYLPNRQEDYSVNPQHKQDFFESASRFLPFLREEDLTPDQSGIRPKLQLPDESTRDFMIREESESGYKGFINLIGIESPGLTSCLAIGKYILKLLN